MVSKRTTLQTSMIAATALILCAQPAKSNQWTDAFKNLLVPSTDANAGSDSISTRETQLANRIVDAINTNKISLADTQSLKSQLDRLKSMESSYRSSGHMGPVETASINNELAKVESSFNQMISTGPGAVTPVNGLNTYGNQSWNEFHGDKYSGAGGPGGYPMSGGPGSTTAGGPTWDGDGHSDGRTFDIRQGNLLKRIDERAANGRLTAAEAADLRSDYRRLEQLESSFRSDGKLTPNELDVLQRGLDSIGAELRDKSESVASQYPEIDRKQAQLKRRIDDGVARRLISFGDAQKLNSNLAWIASIEAGFRQSGGRMDQAEADRVLADLDRLSGKVDRLSINPTQDLLNRKAELQRKIDENSASGKLPQRAARDLRKELDRISYSLEGANTNLPQELLTRISADMDRLNSQITSALTYGSAGGDRHPGDWNGHGPGNWNNR